MFYMPISAPPPPSPLASPTFLPTSPPSAPLPILKILYF